MNRFRFIFILLIVVLVVGYITAWHMSFGRPTSGTSTLRFINRSAHTLESVHLYFRYASESYGVDIFRQGFSRDFTNLAPQCSVTVQYHTPTLILWKIYGKWSPNILDGFVCDDNVLAKPGEDAVISLDASNH